MADGPDRILTTHAGSLPRASDLAELIWARMDCQEVDEAASAVILGAIDVKSNRVEHSRRVADRLVRLGKIVGKGRLLAGTDCGFDTFIRFSLVDPDVAWLQLRSLAEGAELASAEL
jgi:methionine synthase II (cobalamin-independent)